MGELREGRDRGRERGREHYHLNPRTRSPSEHARSAPLVPPPAEWVCARVTEMCTRCRLCGLHGLWRRRRAGGERERRLAGWKALVSLASFLN